MQYNTCIRSYLGSWSQRLSYFSGLQPINRSPVLESLFVVCLDIGYPKIQTALKPNFPYQDCNCHFCIPHFEEKHVWGQIYRTRMIIHVYPPLQSIHWNSDSVVILAISINFTAKSINALLYPSNQPLIMSISIDTHMGVSWNRGTSKSSILMGFSLINPPFWGTP